MRSRILNLSKKFFQLFGDNVKFIPEKRSPNFWQLKRKPIDKIPVPSVNQTLTTYLDYVQVIATKDQFDNTKQLVDHFVIGDGAEVQNKLEQLAVELPNWHNQFWLNDMYMDIRLALPINSNPAYVIPCHKFTSVDDLTKFTSRAMAGIYEFKSMCDRRTLPVDTATGKNGGAPMCMDQYWRMFKSYRESQYPRDYQFIDICDTPPQNEHVIVFYKNQAYVMKTVINGKRLSQTEFKATLDFIINEGENSKSEQNTPVNIFTAGDRDKAAAVTEVLSSDPTNNTFYQKIKTSSFIVCMDEPTSEYCCDQLSPEERFAEILHGMGTNMNSGNRWFEKTNQYQKMEFVESILSIQLRRALFCSENLNKKDIMTADLEETLPTELPTKINWIRSPELDSLLDEIKVEFDHLIDDTDIAIKTFNNFGKAFAKANNCSPDALIQLALQLAYFKCHNRLASTYESASTRRFKHGRVDNIRSAHSYALAWAKSMEDTTCDKSTKYELFRQAMDRQTQIMKENVTGYGIDNHLGALCTVARELGKETRLFDDDMYKEIMRFPLSTSQVPTTSSDTFVGYGAVTPDGYGCCYNPQKDKIIFVITTFKSCAFTNPKKFFSCIEDALNDIKELHS